jgi:hypothetical protein
MSIIAISGYIGSGKDTVAAMIQELIIRNKKYEASGKLMYSDEYVKQLAPQGLTALSKWEIKKFAGKLKQIASILTGIPVEDLEKQEVKDSELGEEWTKYYFTEFGIDYYISKEEYQAYKLERIVKVFEFRPTVRWLLQHLGTDAMREVIHSDIHVNALFADYKGTSDWSLIDGDAVPVSITKYPNWLISDLRFPNEAAAVTKRGGINVRVTRPTLQRLGVIYKDPHPSETALDNHKFDYHIVNNGSLADLSDHVKAMLTLYKYI